MSMAFDDTTEVSDAALLGLYAKGDKQAAGVLTRRLVPVLLAHAYRVLGDRAEAEDVAQDAMLRLWKIAPEWREGEAKVTTWLYRVTANLCTDKLRKRRTVPLESAPEPLDEAASGPEQLQDKARMQALADAGVKIIAPPLFALVELDENNELVASEYAKLAKQAKLEIIAWTLERSGPLAQGGGWYYKSVTDGINNDGDAMKMLDVLAKDVGALGVFSDWPATVTYYANCMGMK